MAIYAIKWEEEILVTSQNKDSLIWYTFIEKEINELDKINQDFENKIKEYNSKYPQAEQDRFADKLIKAEKVLLWEEDYYITTIAESLWITAIEFAQLIKDKATAFEQFYTQCEIERDEAITNLTV
jgi:hypothetical protein